MLREVIADELTRIDDERLELVTITSIDEHRPRMQASINRQMHARKTPILSFKPDEVIRSAARIEELLRKQPNTSPITPDADDE